MVQGVGYRFFVRRVADRLGLGGYVRNLRDGRVEVYAVGTGEQLTALQAEMEQGPRMASVSSVIAEDAPLQTDYQTGFAIEHEP